MIGRIGKGWVGWGGVAGRDFAVKLIAGDSCFDVVAAVAVAVAAAAVAVVVAVVVAGIYWGEGIRCVEGGIDSERVVDKVIADQEAVEEGGNRDSGRCYYCHLHFCRLGRGNLAYHGIQGWHQLGTTVPDLGGVEGVGTPVGGELQLQGAKRFALTTTGNLV